MSRSCPEGIIVGPICNALAPIGESCHILPGNTAEKTGPYIENRQSRLLAAASCANVPLLLSVRYGHPGGIRRAHRCALGQGRDRRGKAAVVIPTQARR